MTVAARPALLPARPGLTDARRRLFEAAIDLFGQRGYYGVSMRDLASALGVQAPALYAHVPSKQHLLFELVTIGHEEHRDRLREALLEVGNDPAEQIQAMVRAHVLAHVTYPDLARVTNNEMRALTDAQLRQAGCSSTCSSEECGSAPSGSPTRSWPCAPSPTWASAPRSGGPLSSS